MDLECNYFLDPLTAITARPGFYTHTNNYSIKNDRKYEKSKYTVKGVCKELGIGQATLHRARIKIFGEDSKITDRALEVIRQHFLDGKNKKQRNPGMTIINLAHDYGINKSTAISISLKILGKRCGYTEEEYKKLGDYFSTVKIRRRMGRKG